MQELYWNEHQADKETIEF